MDVQSRLSRARVFLAFFLAAAILYLQTLSCPFLWDEYRLILGNAQAGAFEWGELASLFTHRYFYIPGSFKNDLPVDLPYYRPVAVLFHGLSYHAFGPFFPAYHIESTFLHVGNALLLFSLLSLLFCREASSPVDERIALASAFLFLVHPRNAETVSIIANQTGLLCTFFSLLSLVCWARILGRSGRPWLLYGLSLLFLLLAMLSKETGYAVPLLHGMLVAVMGRRDRKMLLLCSGYFFLLAVPLVARHLWIQGPSIRESLAIQMARQEWPVGYAMSVMGLLLHQIASWILPLDTHLFQYPFSTKDLTLPQIVLPLGLLLILTKRLWWHKRLLLFGLGWFLVLYLPSSNLISIGTLEGGNLKAGSHHLYPAHAGLCLLLAAFILLRGPAPTRGSAGGSGRLFHRLAFTIVAFSLAFQAFRFSGNFRDADRFYQGVLKRNPLFAGAWINYGWHKLYIEKRPLETEWILLQGLEAARRARNRQARMDMRNNLILLCLDSRRSLEVETIWPCILEGWAVHPLGNLYLWHLIDRYEATTLQGNPGALMPRGTAGG